MVRSTHPTTIEVTTEEGLTERGDCIIGVAATKGCEGLLPQVKSGLRRPGSKVVMRIIIGGTAFEVAGEGDPGLALSHPHDIVIRRSSFLSERTLAVRADAAAKDLPRDMVELLKDPRTGGRLEIEVF